MGQEPTGRTAGGSEAALLMHLPFLPAYRGGVLKSWGFFSLVDKWMEENIGLVIVSNSVILSLFELTVSGWKFAWGCKLACGWATNKTRWVVVVLF